MKTKLFICHLLSLFFIQVGIAQNTTQRWVELPQNDLKAYVFYKTDGVVFKVNHEDLILQLDSLCKSKKVIGPETGISETERVAFAKRFERYLNDALKTRNLEVSPFVFPFPPTEILEDNDYALTMLILEYLPNAILRGKVLISKEGDSANLKEVFYNLSISNEKLNINGKLVNIRTRIQKFSISKDENVFLIVKEPIK